MLATRTDLALEMIARSALVFPLHPGLKTPLTPRGFKDANNNVDRARTFLGNAGQPNYGMVWPDELNPILSLDLDGGDGHTTWKDDWKALIARLGELPKTLTTITPSKGRHLFFRWNTELYGPHPAGDKLFGFTVRWPDKGYVVGPGSTVDGKTYETNLAEIAELPAAWAQEALASAKKKPLLHTNGVGLELPDRTGEGGRYAAIRTYQAQLYNRGLGRDAILTLVRTELAPTFQPALSEPELLERFDRAWKDIELRLGDPRIPGRVDQVPQSTEGFDDNILEELKLGSFPADPEPAAFGGYLGAAVEDLTKATTASPVGLLVSLTAIAGAALATKTEFFGEQTSSFMALLVGESGTGKKGTAMNAAWRSLEAENVWGDDLEGVRLGGLGSGEAIVGHMSRQAKIHGLARGLIWAPEMSEVLIVGRREGSTLTTVLRNAFDREPLTNITKGATIAVETANYQLGALAGVTPDELRGLLSAGTEMTNGFAGRWLSVPVTGRVDRSVDGGTRPSLRGELAERFRDALEQRTGHRHQPIMFEVDAATGLSDYFEFLSALPGVSGTLARRYATIAARIALVHSSLELDDTIPVEHVDRAIALTEYSRTGIGWVFGMSAIVAGKASRALQWLTTDGELTRSQLSLRMFGRRSDGRVDDAIEALSRAKLVEIVAGATTAKGGRPSKVVRLTGLVSSTTRFTAARPKARARTRENNGVKVLEEASTLPLTQSKPPSIPYRTTPVPIPEDPKPLVVVDPGAPPWKSPCHYPMDHGRSHIIRAGQAICLICDPDAELFA